MDNSYALKTIFAYIERLPKPEEHLTKEEFDIRSYSIWAVNEIVEEIIEDVCGPPPGMFGKEHLDVISHIEGFMYEMEYLSLYGNKRKKIMYAVGFNTAEDILNLFL